jgi:thiamine kinase-like enzyme
MEPKNTQDYKDFIRTSLPEWKDLPDEDIQMERLSSLSNLVMLVTAKQNVSPKQFIFRKFSPSEGLVDKSKEAKVFAEMSHSGYGPKCYGVNDDYRLEEYFDARPILNEEYNQPEYRRKLAIAIANLHKVHVQGIDQTPLFEACFADPAYFKDFDKKCNQNIYTPDEQKKIDELKTSSSDENQKFLKEILPTDDIVFSHNDLLAGNVLIRKEDRHIILIDYEYAAYNFRGYDIGNMFKEATFDYTYPEPPEFKVVESYFPSDDELREFIKYYIAFYDMNQLEQDKNFDNFIKNYDSLKEYLEKTYKAEELETRIAKIFRETMIGVMLSHYYWMNWGIKKAHATENKFDYVSFSHTKFCHYEKLKKEFKAECKL